MVGRDKVEELPGLDIGIAFGLEYCQFNSADLGSGITYRDQDPFSSFGSCPVFIRCECAEGCLKSEWV